MRRRLEVEVLNHVHRWWSLNTAPDHPDPRHSALTSTTPITESHDEGLSSKTLAPSTIREMVLVTLLSLLNLIGLVLLLLGLGGLGQWQAAQFTALYGLFEAANGIAGVVLPNVWRLPVAALEGGGNEVRLKRSTLLVPHWVSLGRVLAGGALLVFAGWRYGVEAQTLLLVPCVFILATGAIGVSLVMARIGVAHADLDVVQFMAHWRGRDHVVKPVSASASLTQFVLGLSSLPAKLLPLSILFGPALRPSGGLLLVATVLAVGSILLAAAAWAGHVAPASETA